MAARVESPVTMASRRRVRAKSPMLSFFNASVTIPSERRRSTAGRLSALAYRTTRSGFAATTTSMFGRSPGPMSGASRAESGYESQVVRPITRLPAPMANSISVVAGLSEMIRRATPGTTSWPKSSRTSPAGRGRSRPQDMAGTTTARQQKTSLPAGMNRENARNFVLRRPNDATAPPARVDRSGADDESSPGSGPLRSPSRPRSQWYYERAFNSRYSGGAAPVLHRLPWLPSAMTAVTSD